MGKRNYGVIDLAVMFVVQDADENKDKEHWGKFPGFSPYCKEFNSDGFKPDFSECDFLFMRWKVCCLFFEEITVKVDVSA